MWDAGQYLRFGGERARPFFDLVAQIGATDPRRVVDLGCGPGNLTAALAQRWPGATVTGMDNSPEMIDAATAALLRGGLGGRPPGQVESPRRGVRRGGHRRTWSSRSATCGTGRRSTPST